MPAVATAKKSFQQRHGAMALEASLVAFPMRHLARCCVTINVQGQNNSESAIAREFGWIVPEADIASDDLEAEQRTFYSDRYGGEHISTHGGSVRCALVGTYQVKGVGCNILRGKGAPADHATGEMTIADCVREAIWSSIFAAALPYGAVASHYVLDTGLRTRSGPWAERARGLLVRDAATRPAHFMRSMRFDPSDAEALATYPSEVERVRLDIQRLPELLPDVENADDDPLSRMRHGLCEMARRFAKQSAAAKAKGLMHGAIGSSNIAIDGRWLDFGSTTALPGYGDVRHFAPYWDDQSWYERILSILTHYANKYVLSPRNQSVEAAEVVDAYGTAFQCALREQVLALTGIPQVLIQQLGPSDAANRLYRYLLSLMKAGHFTPAHTYPEDDAFGTNDVPEILYRLSVAYMFPTASPLDGLHAVFNGTHAELMEAYRMYLQSAEEGALANGIASAAFRHIVVLNTLKQSKSVGLLSHDRLRSHLDQYANHEFDPSERSCHLRKAYAWVTSRYVPRFAACYDYRSLFSMSEGHRRYFDARSYSWATEGEEGPGPFFGTTPSLPLRHEELPTLRSYFTSRDACAY